MKRFESFSSIILMTTALAALLIGVGDLFFNFEAVPYLKKTPQISLILLGTIGVALGVERLVSFEEVKQEINSLKGSIDSAVPSQFIRTRPEVYLAVARAVSEARTSISILGIISENDYDEVNDYQKQPYLESMITVMKANQNLEVRFVFGSQNQQLSQKEEAFLKNRKALFENQGLINRVRFKHVCISPGFNILIIDEKYFSIGFPTLSLDDSLRNMIQFSEKKDVILSIRKWYDEYVWDKSKKW